MFLIQQLYLLQNVLPHFGEAGPSLLPTPQHQPVLIVTSADSIQGLSHGLQEEARYLLLQMIEYRTHTQPACSRQLYQFSSSSLKRMVMVTDWSITSRVCTCLHKIRQATMDSVHITSMVLRDLCPEPGVTFTSMSRLSTALQQISVNRQSQRVNSTMQSLSTFSFSNVLLCVCALKSWKKKQAPKYILSLLKDF